MEIRDVVNFSKIFIEDYEKMEIKLEENIRLLKPKFDIPTPSEVINLLKSIDLDHMIEFGEKTTEEDKQRKIKIIPKDKWSQSILDSMDDKLYSITPLLINNPIFDGFVSELIETYSNELSINEPNVEAFVKNSVATYLEKIIIKNRRNSLSEELLEQYAKIFLIEIRNKPIKKSTLTELYGINFEQKQFKVNKNIKIKKCDKSDFYDFDDFSSLYYSIEVTLPYVALEVTKKELTRSFNLKIDETIIQLIKLYTNNPLYIGSRYHFKYSMITKRMFEKEIISNIKPKNSYNLKNTEIGVFTIFITELSNIILNNKTNENFNPIEIALERFNWALRDDLEIDRRLMFSVMGLEALLLPEFHFGKTKKLSNRLSYLFATLNYDLNEIKLNSKRAYKFRNYIVHGTKYPDIWKEEMKNLFPEIIRYLRDAILIFLLNIDKSRDFIITLIEDSKTKKHKFDELKKFTNKLRKYKL